MVDVIKNICCIRKILKIFKWLLCAGKKVNKKSRKEIANVLERTGRNFVT